MTKQDTLVELNGYWNTHTTCELKKEATQAVYGDGSASARIVFIGEAPGKQEDLQGKPFVGASGKFLAEMLATIHLRREDVYITNTVKYRPPNNRDPQPEEKAACAEWLYAELNLIKPDVIVFLGRHAMNTFFPELRISEVHGTVIHKKILNLVTDYFIPLYHPASALYNGALRETLKKDFAKIPIFLKQLQKISDEIGVPLRADR